MSGDLRERRALERLVARGVLTAEQAEAVLAELAGQPPERRGGVWEVLGYAGGALVLGGAALLVGMSWEDLSRAARVGLLVAATLVLLAAGAYIAGGPRGVRGLATGAPSRRSRIVAVLLTLAVGTATMALGSGLEGAAGLDVPLVVAAAGTALAALACAVLPSVLGLLAAGGFAYWLAVAAAGEWFGGDSVPQMLVLIALGVVWAVLAVGGVLERPAGGRPGRVRRELGLALGAATALSGAQWTIGSAEAVSYGTTFALAVVCFAAFLRLHSTVLLVFGVLGVTVSVPEAVYHWTDGALGGPLVVLLVGVVLLAVGGFGLRLRNRVGSGPA